MSKPSKNLLACHRHDYFCAALTGLCQGAYMMNGIGVANRVLGSASPSAALWMPAIVIEFANEIADAAVVAEIERVEREEAEAKGLLENQS